MPDLDLNALGDASGSNQSKGQNPILGVAAARKKGKAKKNKGKAGSGEFFGGSKKELQNQVELERALANVRTQEHADQRWVDVQADSIGTDKWDAIKAHEKTALADRATSMGSGQQFEESGPSITAEDWAELGKAGVAGAKVVGRGIARLGRRAAGAAKSRFNARGGAAPSDDASAGGFSSQDSEDFWSKLGEDTGLPQSKDEF